MNIFFYFILAIFAYYIGRIDKKVRVAGISVAVPLCLTLAFGIVISAIFLLKFALVLLMFFAGLVIFIFKKMKFIIGVKISALFVSIIASCLGLVGGPPGWVFSLICILVGCLILSSLKEMAVKTYIKILEKMAILLMYIRKNADYIRAKLPGVLKFLVLLIEIPIVCGLAVNGLWELMNWADGQQELTKDMFRLRCLVIIPFMYIIYKSYIRDTTPPNQGKESGDLPGPDLTSIITNLNP